MYAVSMHFEPTDTDSRPRPRDRRITRGIRITRGLLGGNLFACCVAYAFMLREVKSVVWSGPALLLLGVLLVILGIRQRYRGAGLAGLANIGICALFVAAVLSLDLSPYDAEVPFAIIGGVFLSGLLPLVLLAIAATPRRASDDCCSSCGYLLIGLTVPRCPECGEAFDPRALTDDARRSLAANES